MLRRKTLNFGVPAVGRVALTLNSFGFTLVEILVVMALITILAGISMPALRAVRMRARVANTRAMISSLQMALSMYDTDYGVYPQSAETGGTQRNGNSRATGTGYYNLVKALTVATGGSYMDFKKDDLDESDSSKPVLLDSWGRAYIYVSQKYWDGNSWEDVSDSRGPFWPNNTSPDKDNNAYNIYSLGADGKTYEDKTHTSAQDWNNSELYDNLEDGYSDDVASTDPRDDDINSWE